MSKITADVDDERCEICAIHDEALKTTPYKPFSCPSCGEALTIDDGTVYLFPSTTTVIADVYDKPPFEHTDIYRCEKCQEFFTLSATKIIWNANHDIYYRKHP